MRIHPYLSKPLYFAKDCVSSCIQKIKTFAKGIFDWIASFSRYFGSKVNAGWHKELHPMTVDQAANYLPYVGLVAYVHDCNPYWSAPFGWSPISPESFSLNCPNIIGNERCFHDKGTGLKIAILEKGDEIAIVFGALDSLTGELKDKKTSPTYINFNQYINVVSNFAGIIPQMHLEAEGFVETLLTHPRLEGKQIILVGQCLGASIASYVALRTKQQAICFNGIAIGAGLQYRIGDETLKKADHFVTNIAVKDDFAGDGTRGSLLDRAFCAIGVRTPGSFGMRYRIPSAYSTPNEIHVNVLGSFMQFLGYDRRTKPADPTFQKSFNQNAV